MPGGSDLDNDPEATAALAAMVAELDRLFPRVAAVEGRMMCAGWKTELGREVEQLEPWRLYGEDGSEQGYYWAEPGATYLYVGRWWRGYAEKVADPTEIAQLRAGMARAEHDPQAYDEAMAHRNDQLRRRDLTTVIT